MRDAVTLFVSILFWSMLSLTLTLTLTLVLSQTLALIFNLLLFFKAKAPAICKGIASHDMLLLTIEVDQEDLELQV